MNSSLKFNSNFGYKLKCILTWFIKFTIHTNIHMEHAHGLNFALNHLNSGDDTEEVLKHCLE